MNCFVCVAKDNVCPKTKNKTVNLFWHTYKGDIQLTILREQKNLIFGYFHIIFFPFTYKGMITLRFLIVCLYLVASEAFLVTNNFKLRNKFLSPSISARNSRRLSLPRSKIGEYVVISCGWIKIICIVLPSFHYFVQYQRCHQA